MKKFLGVTLASIFATVCVGWAIATHGLTPASSLTPTSEVLLTADVNWEQLNPARGDRSPQAGTLWGDRTGPGPAGFLLKPVDGFRSPPHIHNVAYRGVVIEDTIHNDDPAAEDMFMPPGSFWTQPAGEVHITAARGDRALAYIEVEDSFGVQPAADAFDSGERPVNVDASNIVWLDASSTDWIDQSTLVEPAKSPAIAFLWGDFRGAHPNKNLNGTLVKFPAGFSGIVHSQGSPIRAVVIKGQPQYAVLGKAGRDILKPGSYFSSTGQLAHQIESAFDAETILYVRTNGKFNIASSSTPLR